MVLESSRSQTNKIYKIIVVGDAGVGKTSLIRMYSLGIYTERYKSTIGVDYSAKKIGDSTMLQIWDIGGQERVVNMTHVYYKNACAALVVYDVANEKSLEKAELWIKDIREKVFITYTNSDNKQINRDIPIILVAAKCDLKPDTSTGYNFSLKHNCSQFLETSSKNNQGIDELFNHVLLVVEMEDKLKQEIKPQFNPLNIDHPELFKIDIEHKNITKKKGCCS